MTDNETITTVLYLKIVKPLLNNQKNLKNNVKETVKN